MHILLIMLINTNLFRKVVKSINTLTIPRYAFVIPE